MADNYTGTDWVTRTKISTDIMSKMDEGIEKSIEAGDELKTEVDELSSNLGDIGNISVKYFYGQNVIEYVEEACASTTTTAILFYSNDSASVSGLPAGYMTGVIICRGGLVTIWCQRYSDNSLYINGRSNNTGWAGWSRITGTIVDTSSIGDPVVMSEDD